MGPDIDARRVAAAAKLNRRDKVVETATRLQDRPAEPMLRPFVGLAYRPEDAARMLGLSKSTLWERVREGRLPVKRDGGATVILHRDLEAYLEALPYDERKPAQ